MDGINTLQRPRGVSIKVAVLALALAAVIPSVIFRCVLMLMYVPSESMFPAIEVGDVLIGVRDVDSLERGEIVAFQSEQIMIKRIIGLSGETVNVDEFGAVYINGVLLEEPYVANPREGIPQEFQIPDDCVLLFGDNREASYDARFWENPYVETGAILSVARFNLFSGVLK